MTTLHATVPGNILLLGEYAVLEEGGLGLAMAVEPRVRLEASPAGILQVDGQWPGGSGPSPLADAAVGTVSEYLGGPCTGRIRVDSTDFFSPGGRKSGLGSSAAVTVAVVCALLRLAGRSVDSADALFLAVQAHRRAQGGTGSGYDVLTSFHGGSGIVRGGARPAWQPCGLPPGCRLFLFPGPAPVSTAEAVARYARWKEANPGPARDFLRESNAAILAFSRARSLDEAFAHFGSCRTLGIQLGGAIGVSAEIVPPAGLDPRWCKALGAGNELGVCLAGSAAGPPAAAVRPILPSAEGVRWA